MYGTMYSLRPSDQSLLRSTQGWRDADTLVSAMWATLITGNRGIHPPKRESASDVESKIKRDSADAFVHFWTRMPKHVTPDLWLWLWVGGLPPGSIFHESSDRTYTFRGHEDVLKLNSGAAYEQHLLLLFRRMTYSVCKGARWCFAPFDFHYLSR